MHSDAADENVNIHAEKHAQRKYIMNPAVFIEEGIHIGDLFVEGVSRKPRHGRDICI